MYRFAIFVDGSNLFGSLKDMQVQVEDYEKFFRFVLERAQEAWKGTLIGGPAPSTQLARIYWYVVGDMDTWDLADAQAQAHLRSRFDADTDLRKPYLAAAGQKYPGDAGKMYVEAWATFFAEMKDWYQRKRENLDGMQKFHHAIRVRTDFIDVIECGRWKVDLLGRSIAEKMIDTALAVDMLAKELTYDVAILLTGDADAIPSVNLMKGKGKHIGVGEFLRGFPPEKNGRGFSSRLKSAADFVVPLYEMDLVKHGITKKVSESPGGVRPVKTGPASV